MIIRKSLIRIWLVLSLISILVDVACFWLVQHTPVQVPGEYAFNYITVFLVSAPAPFVLAVVLTLLGGLLALLRWIWIASCRAMHGPVLGISVYAPSRTITPASALKH
jgi:hypothetical protein